jgi:hypothetical protein
VAHLNSPSLTMGVDFQLENSFARIERIDVSESLAQAVSARTMPNVTSPQLLARILFMGNQAQIGGAMYLNDIDSISSTTGVRPPVPSPDGVVNATRLAQGARVLTRTA